MTVGEVNALPVMVNKPCFTIQIGMRVTTDSIFLFEKCYGRIRRRHTLKEFIDPKLSLCKATSVSTKLVVNIRLRNRKSGELLRFRFYNVL